MIRGLRGPAEADGSDRGLHAQGLLAAGYRPFHDPFQFALLGAAYRGSYQLRFADPGGTRYVIMVHHGRAPASLPHWQEGEFFSPMVQFSRGGMRFTVELLPRGEGVREIEAFVEGMWRAMQLDYYEGPAGQPGYPQAGYN